MQKSKKWKIVGRDKAYEIANRLPHERRGRDIFVFAEAYEEDFQRRKQNAIEQQKKATINNVYKIRKFQTN